MIERNGKTQTLLERFEPTAALNFADFVVTRWFQFAARDDPNRDPSQANQTQHTSLNLQSPRMQPSVRLIRVPFKALQEGFSRQQCAENEGQLKCGEEDRCATEDEQAQPDRSQPERTRGEQRCRLKPFRGYFKQEKERRDN